MKQVEEIVRKAEVDLEQEQLGEEQNKKISLKETIIKSKGQVVQMEADIEKLNPEIANGIINGTSVDELVLRRSMIRESLSDVKAIPARLELQAKEIERKIKEIKAVIFRKVTDVLKIERMKRVKTVEEAIKTSAAEWLHITGTLSKNFSGGVIPPGWSSLKQDIYKILDTIYESTGSNFRG